MYRNEMQEINYLYLYLYFVFVYVNSTTQRCPKKIIQIFLLKDFFHFPPVSTSPVMHLEPRISPRIFEKI